MNYREVINYIHEKEKLGSVFGLEAIHELLFRLGNPQKEIKAIHIAGTNGKGSIMSFVEEALIQAGYKIGRYISPTIYDYRERWMLNHVWAAEEEVCSVISEVADKVSEMIEDGYNSPTAFEIETAAAFLLFRKWQVDYMLIECGMGGRLDATNVLDDAINIMASISMDHMKVLGDNVLDITREKLGIVRKSSVLITYPQTEEVMQEIRSYASDNAVKLIVADPTQLKINKEDIYGSDITYKDENYRISIGGRYQILNAITAIEALGYILSSGDRSKPEYKEINEEDSTLRYIKEGLKKTTWDARFEVVNSDPVVIVDGAHNEDAWLRLRESIETHFTNQKVIFIIGVLADKEYNKMVKILAPLAQAVYVVQTDSPRALPKEVLAECFKEAGVMAVTFSKIEDAISAAYDTKKATVVCGSLTVTGRAIKYFSKEPEYAKN